jgi:hypothetical protein
MTEEDFLVYASLSMNTLSSILLDLETAYKSVKEEFVSLSDYHPRKKRSKGLVETYENIIEVVTKLLEIKRKLITKDELYAMLCVKKEIQNNES